MKQSREGRLDKETVISVCGDTLPEQTLRGSEWTDLLVIDISLSFSFHHTLIFSQAPEDLGILAQMMPFYWVAAVVVGFALCTYACPTPAAPQGGEEAGLGLRDLLHPLSFCGCHWSVASGKPLNPLVSCLQRGWGPNSVCLLSSQDFAEDQAWQIKYFYCHYKTPYSLAPLTWTNWL